MRDAERDVDLREYRFHGLAQATKFITANDQRILCATDFEIVEDF